MDVSFLYMYDVSGAYTCVVQQQTDATNKNITKPTTLTNWQTMVLDFSAI